MREGLALRLSPHAVQVGVAATHLYPPAGKLLPSDGTAPRGYPPEKLDTPPLPLLLLLLPLLLLPRRCRCVVDRGRGVTLVSWQSRGHVLGVIAREGDGEGWWWRV